MEGSVENISLGKAVGKEVRKKFVTETKSPISTRRSDCLNGNIRAHTANINTNVNTTTRLKTEPMEIICNSECNIARSLAEDFVNYKVGFTNARPPSVYAETLRRVGDEIEEKYDITLSGIVNQLKYDPDTDGRQAFYASLDAMFEEGPCSWGRVVMVYVFAARLAKYCQKHNRDDVCIEDLIRYSGDYVAVHLTKWIKEQQGGWMDFCEKFKSKDWRDKAVFNSLLVTGLLLGGMATLRLFTK